MRCLVCGNFTLKTLCKICNTSLTITPRTREFDGFKVYSFFDFSGIQTLLYAKYSIIGSKIYHILAKKAVQYLKDSNVFYDAYAIGIDDKISKQGYAHNAIFLHHLKKVGIHPLYYTLLARNSVSYAGKSLEFREKNPRNFILQRSLKGLEKRPVVLIDDIITTGATLKEAKRFLDTNGITIAHAFVLADAKY